MLLPTIQQNIEQVRSSIARACQKTGRDWRDITLIAVSKTQPIEKIQAAYECGLSNFGENYVQEALPKVSALETLNISWHFIGHLQTNKINKIIPYFQYMHTVDSLHLAQEIDKQAEKHKVKPTILLQVNISGETSKNGIEPDQLISLARQLTSLPTITMNGLMTIAPFVTDPEEVRPIFRKLRLLRDQLQKEIPECTWQHLSMGMTNDYAIAIEEGATMVRIGRAIFGERS